MTVQLQRSRGFPRGSSDGAHLAQVPGVVGERGGDGGIGLERKDPGPRDERLEGGGELPHVGADIDDHRGGRRVENPRTDQLIVDIARFENRSGSVARVATRGQVPEAVAFGGPPPQLSALWHQTAAELRRADPQSRAMALWSLALPHLAGNVGLTGDALAVALGQHLRVAFACFLGQSPSALPLHEQMAQAWGLPASRHAALRQTLVLCADTLLNLSSLSSRMIASVQGSLAACLLAGMNYGFIRLSGGEFEAVEALFDAVLASGDPAAVAAAYRARGEVLPGFNHPMLVQGDPRAAALVALATSLGSPAQQWVAPMAQAHQLHPALDFGLVAVRRAVEGPRDAALTLVDAARCAGLLAHVLEQRQNVARMWVQARYVGPPPICRSD